MRGVLISLSAGAERAAQGLKDSAVVCRHSARAAAMSFVGADLFGLDEEPLYPEAYDYYRTPSLENSRKFLEASGLYVPYEAARIVAANVLGAATRVGGPRAPRGGGTKRHRGSTSPLASASASAPAPAPDADENVRIFQRADFLHDIHPGGPINSVIFNRVLQSDVRVPEELLQRLWEHSCESEPGKYTKNAIKTLADHFAFAARKLRVTNIAKDQVSRAIPAIKREHMRADVYMSKAVSGWLTPNADGVAEIVFDGILEDPLRRPASDGIHTVSHLRSLATCAFLQWMIGEWPEPFAGAGAVVPREIRFLTGTFQTLDVGGHDAFMKRWVGYLRRDASALKAVASISVAYLNASAVPSGTPGVAMAPARDSALIVHGRRVPFAAKLLPERPTRPPPAALSKEDVSLRLSAFLASKPARQVTYSKQDLVNMFRAYITLLPAQLADPRTEAVVAQVISVNAFRDAFKADVALARGAVYLTVDRLALVYYELRRRALGAKSRGLAILTSDKNGGTMELNTYEA